jgi:hypothetical protein
VVCGCATGTAPRYQRPFRKPGHPYTTGWSQAAGAQVASLALVLPLAAHPPPPPPAPARVLAFAREFRFTLSRPALPAGPVRLQLRNIGEDEHDLRVIGPRGAARAETGVVRPGRVGELRVRLPRGSYTLLCTVADHAGRGMTATLVVRARARGRR